MLDEPHWSRQLPGTRDVVPSLDEPAMLKLCCIIKPLNDAPLNKIVPTIRNLTMLDFGLRESRQDCCIVCKESRNGNRIIEASGRRRAVSVVLRPPPSFRAAVVVVDPRP